MKTNSKFLPGNTPGDVHKNGAEAILVLLAQTPGVAMQRPYLQNGRDAVQFIVKIGVSIRDTQVYNKSRMEINVRTLNS